jgi:hypothetical protein
MSVRNFQRARMVELKNDASIRDASDALDFAGFDKIESFHLLDDGT